MSCGIVIVAAGKGKRMGTGVNKQFIILNDKPLLVHTLERFQNIPWLNEIVLVVHIEEIDAIKELVEEYNLSVTKIVPGGKERQDSVQNGLVHIDSEWVMVHDGARPFINKNRLKELYLKVMITDAVVLGVPVKDTIKVIEESGIINKTLDRKSLWAIQTPQAFRASILKEAYNSANLNGYIGTDDSSLVEMLGINVHVIDGDYSNIKITTKDDLLNAELILMNWSESSV